MLPLAMPRPLVESNVLPTPVLPYLTLDFLSDSYLWAPGGESPSAFDFASEALIQRSSTASYYGADGLLQIAAANQPRLDHIPGSSTPRGLLVESAATNLLANSHDLQSGSWTKVNASISSNVAMAPDGTMTADKLVENTAGGTHDIRYPSLIVTPGQTYTLSIFIKAAERSAGQIQIYGGGGITTLFDTAGDGSIINVGTYGGWTNGAVAVEKIGDFRRFSITVAPDFGSVTAAIFMQNAGGSASYTGDGSSGLILWGGQLEAGTLATSHIPTNGAAVTRSADLYELPASWWQTAGGSFTTEYELQQQITTAVATLYNSADQDRYIELTNPGLKVRHGGAISNLNLGAVASGTVATRIAPNDLAGSFNGGAIVTNTSGAVPSGLDRLAIGGTSSSGPDRLNGWVKSLSYWPILFGDDKLVSISQPS